MRRLLIGFSYSQSFFKDYWSSWIKSLNSKLGSDLKIEAYFSSSQKEEKTLINSKKFDLFVGTPPLGVCNLLRKNYDIIGIFQNTNATSLYFVSKNKIQELKQKRIKVGLIKDSSFLTFILILNALFKIDMLQLEQFFYDSYEEMVDKLEEGEVDGIVVEDIPPIKEKIKRFFVERLIPGEVYLLAPREKKQETIELINLIKQLSHQISFKEIDFWRKKPWIIYNYIAQFLEECSLLSKIATSFPIGILIYKEHYEYLNSYASQVLGYSLEEFQKLKPEELFYYEEDKKRVKKVIEKRLKGKDFTNTYNIALKRKDGKKVVVWAVSRTVYYQGSPGGVVIFIDKTKEDKIERFNKVLLEVNSILITSGTEKEIYERLITTLFEELNLKAILITTIKESEDKIEEVLGKPKEVKEIFEKAKEDLLKEEAFYSCIKEAYKTKKVQVVPEIKKILSNPVAKSLYEMGINSACSIPIVVDGKVISIITLYHEEPFFFEKTIFKLAEEIQKDISFAIKKAHFHIKNYILNAFLNKAENIFIIAYPNGKIEYINPYTFRVLELSEEDLEKDVFSLLNIPLSCEKFCKNKLFNHKKYILKYKKPGEELIIDLEILYLTVFSDVKRIIVLGKDISREKKLEELIYRLEHFDDLTGFLNFNGFSKKVEEILKILKEEGYLIFIDLYNFTAINRFHGVEKGNVVLKQLAERLKKVVEKRGIIGKTGADEFALFFTDIKKEELNKIVQEIFEVFSKPVKLDHKNLFIEFNAGIVMYPADGESFKELWEKATILVSNLKKKGPNIVEYFNPELDAQAQKVLRASELIKKALKDNLFIFFYQPYYDINTFKVSGLEALVRIKEKSKIIPPSEFVDHLENSPYIEEFEKFSLRKNLAKIKEWKVPISINISPQSIVSLAILNYLEECKELIEELSTYFIIEITERTFVANVENAKKALNIIKNNYPALISLDDFGTGYSSLNYLKDFPIDIIKLDKSFVQGILWDKKLYYITKAVVEIALKLKIKIIAEGVEEEGQLQILKDLFCISENGEEICHYVQGFFLAKPMPEEEIVKFLKKNCLPKIS